MPSRPMHEFTPPSLLPRVLLVEDHDLTRRMQVRFLSRTYAVDFASTGEEAVAMAPQRAYVAVVIDLHLAGELTGIDVMRALKATAQHRATAMIAVTGFARPHDHERLIEAGFDLYLSKPFRWSAFADAIRHAAHLSLSGDGGPPALPWTTAPWPGPLPLPDPAARFEPPTPHARPDGRPGAYAAPMRWRSLGDL